MSWRRLAGSRARGVVGGAEAVPAKLANLARAMAFGLRVPDSVWAWAREAEARAGELGVDLARERIVRSAAPDEDQASGSKAGQYASVVVPRGTAPEAAVREVVASLEGRGAVFVQPLVVAERAGVAFFDGFWFERAEGKHDNEVVTSGGARGEVVRGHVAAPGDGDAWSDFLRAVARVLPDARAIDLEYAWDAVGPVLLQVRPAAFAVRRNPTLSLANHREILGDLPSRWIVSVLETCGPDVLAWFAAVDPIVATWGESYAVGVAERAWMCFSFFYRLMDRWGLPRAWVAAGVGGAVGDVRTASRLPPIGRVPVLLKLQLASVRRMRTLDDGLARVGRAVDAASTLPELFAANVEAMRFAITSNFAINAVLTGVARVRRALGVPERAGALVTLDLMRAFDALRALPDDRKSAALDGWLATHGHRGPLESDPAEPRFAELRDVLVAELARSSMGRATASQAGATRSPGGLLRLAYTPDRVRERFRDRLMHPWRRLRSRALELGRAHVSAGHLDRPEDVFSLDAAALASPPETWRAAVRDNEARRAAARDLRLPVTATRDDIEAIVRRAAAASDAPDPGASSERRVFDGIGLGRAVVEGRVSCARALSDLLGKGAVADARVLVVPTLEPSWAVVFPRFAAVVSELGGELSHGAILLRESGQPAVLDCHGILDVVRDGDVVRVDPIAARVTIIRT